MIRPPSLLAFSAVVADGEIVLTIHAEALSVRAVELARLLEAILALGYDAVVLDLSEVQSMDAATTSVVENAVRRVAESGSSLRVLPSTTAGARRDEPSASQSIAPLAVGRFTPEFDPRVRIGLPTVPALSGGNDLIGQLASGASRTTRDAAIDGSLRLVVALATSTVRGAEGASVTLRRRGQLETVAATNETIAAMDAAQYATAEGPCIEAALEGRRVHSASLQGDTRWPAFGPRALSLGIRSILSSPLVVEGAPAGALNIYANRPENFGDRERFLASQFATEASKVLAEAAVWASGAAGTGVADRLHDALRIRRVIAQAEGVLMEREGVSSDTAFSLLRRISLLNQRTISQEANVTVESASDPWSRAAPEEGRGRNG